ncbi:MAG TPA: hypothetical protein VIB01_04300 [Steroidobacteraceae bacterium]|jgi:hypothetical protein
MSPPAPHPPIRIGVLLDARRQEGWTAEAIRHALAVPGASLHAVALLRNAAPRRAARLFSLVDGLDRRARCRGEPLFARVDATAGLAAPVLAVRAAGGEGGWTLDAASAARLRDCDVDVWLCFTRRPAARPLPRIARRGVWSLEIGNGTPAASAWAGAAEIIASTPVTMVAVVDYMRAPGADLYRSFGATIGSSVRRNRLRALCKGLRLFARLLPGLARDGDGWSPPAGASVPPPAPYPARSRPTPAAVMRLCSRIAATVSANRWARLRWREQWRIAYCFFDGCGGAARWRYLVPPPDRLWADPFVAEEAGRHFIFFEELAGASGRGRIMAAEVSERGGPGPVVPVLERPYHLSYPFLFRWNGAHYMLPETGENHSVELYRCERLPGPWRLERVLLRDIFAVDATLCEAAGRWWMFVNVAEPGADCNDELHLYWSAVPVGPWTAHAANPVVTDVRRARGAGPLFTGNGALFRPSQDSSRVYGEAVIVNQVEVLNEREYRESPVVRIRPGSQGGVRCIHTFGGSGRVGVMDLLVRHRRW